MAQLKISDTGTATKKGGFFVSTDHIEPRFREEFRRDCMKLMHVPALIETDREQGMGMDASILSYSFGELLVLSTTHNTHSRFRDRQMILSSGVDFYIIHIVEAGRHVGDFDGVSVSAGPGDLYITDMNRPFKYLVETGSVKALIVQRGSLEASLGNKNLHGVVLRREWPLARLLISHFSGIHALAPQLPLHQSGPALEALTSLLSGCLNGIGAGTQSEVPVLNEGLRHRVLAFIDQHLLNPDLGPDQLIRHFHVSRAHLYRLFEADGGIARIIREKRLDLAFKRLAGDQTGKIFIKQIAHDFCFADSSKFIRAFRARFNETPGTIHQERKTSITSAHKGPVRLQSYLQKFSKEWGPAQA